MEKYRRGVCGDWLGLLNIFRPVRGFPPGTEKYRKGIIRNSWLSHEWKKYQRMEKKYRRGVCGDWLGLLNIFRPVHGFPREWKISIRVVMCGLAGAFSIYFVPFMAFPANGKYRRG
ncbi:hypothetical protein AVEN_213012-1, partial [Araneus ventricosus]